MSYVQGTRVQLRADFIDVDTGAPTDPDEVLCSIERPDGMVVAMGVTKDDELTGRYTVVLDTSPMPGRWSYQFESTGTEAVVGRSTVHVVKRISVPA